MTPHGVFIYSLRASLKRRKRYGRGTRRFVQDKRLAKQEAAKGEIEIMVDGKTTVLKEGDTAFAPKNIPHSWKVVGSDKAKMITSAFPAGIEIMFNELAQLPAGPPDFGKVLQIPRIISNSLPHPGSILGAVK